MKIGNDDYEGHTGNIFICQNHVSYPRYGKKMECVNNLTAWAIIFVRPLPSQQGVVWEVHQSQTFSTHGSWFLHSQTKVVSGAVDHRSSEDHPRTVFLYLQNNTKY